MNSQFLLKCKRIFKPIVDINRKLYKKLLQIKTRKNLKNSDFTLITSTCIGGVIYNLCWKRFDSPTN